jgi:hypothetical protein
VFFNSRNTANSLVDCVGIKENKLEAFIPARVVVKKGILRGIPLDINTEQLLGRIRTENPYLHVTGAKRLQMLQQNAPTQGTEAEINCESEAKEKAWVDSKSVCLDFKSQSLPNEVVTWNANLKIIPFSPAIKLCYKCGRYGHLSTRCNGKEICLTCGGDHPTGKDHKYSKKPRIINCGDDHTAFSEDCGERSEEEKLNKLILTKITSAKEASKIFKTTNQRPRCPLSLNSQKKTSLTLGGGVL